MDVERLLTVKELAETLRVSRAKAYALIQTGELQLVRVGRCVRIPSDALKAYLARNTTGATAAVTASRPSQVDGRQFRSEGQKTS